MKRKSTTISIYNEPLQDSELSYSSLFQKSSDPTPDREKDLIHTMYLALRSGAFEDPSLGSSDDWNLLFDSYNNLWRQCAYQGSTTTTRDLFRSMCRSLRSDNPTEQLLYLLHTAETPDDLDVIFSLLEQQAVSSLPCELLCDKLWAASFCLLSQMSRQQTPTFLPITLSIARSFANSSLLPWRFFADLLTDDFTATTHCGHITAIDDERFITHFHLILLSVRNLMLPYHHDSIPFHSTPCVEYPLGFYIRLLTREGEIAAATCYVKLIPTEGRLRELQFLLEAIRGKWFRDPSYPAKDMFCSLLPQPATLLTAMLQIILQPGSEYSREYVGTLRLAVCFARAASLGKSVCLNCWLSVAKRIISTEPPEQGVEALLSLEDVKQVTETTQGDEESRFANPPFAGFQEQVIGLESVLKGLLEARNGSEKGDDVIAIMKRSEEVGQSDCNNA